MKYKCLVRTNEGSLEEQIIDTNESVDRLLAHAHIHSAVQIIEEPNFKPEIKKEVEAKPVKSILKK